MFPQKSKVGQYVISAIVLIFVFKNPATAAAFVHQAVTAIGQFAGALH